MLDAQGSQRDFSTVGVVGLGTMGSGIAEVMARAGLKVVAVELNEHTAALGRGRIEDSTGRALAGGKVSAAERAHLLDNIAYTTRLADLSAADLVIEAIPEHFDDKAAVLNALDDICAPETIIATNTSSLSVTELSVATARPSKVIGLHFFNPAPVMNLVEVIQTVVTDPSVVEDAETLVRRLGKTDVTAADRAGFIGNALLFGYFNHAAAMYDARYASREDIDAAMRLGCGYPMGPLALLDLIGLDTAYEILDTIYHQTRDRLHAPAPLLKQMITAGLRGRKAGRGFYTYQAPGSPVVVADDRTPSRRAGAVGSGIVGSGIVGSGIVGSGNVGSGVAADVRPIARVGVVGSGTMATGIAEVLAKAGYDVHLVARAGQKADRARAAVERSLGRAVERGKLSVDARDAALTRVTVGTSLDDLGSSDLVLEAVVEELSVKREIFAALGRVCRPGAVLATTTSSLPVIECAVASGRPEDVVGMHFFNPAPVMRLVEVVRTVATPDDVVATAHAVCGRLGKHAVDCGDRAGFIVNALLFPYLNDAVKMLQAHYATADDIDTAMKLGCGLPMGPFELLDVVGLDVSLAIQRALFEEFREPGFVPAPLLEHLVTAGYLGRKTGRGFRDYRAR